MFSLNGELLVDPSAGDAAFTEIAGETFVPACTLGVRDDDDITMRSITSIIIIMAVPGGWHQMHFNLNHKKYRFVNLAGGTKV